MAENDQYAINTNFVPIVRTKDRSKLGLLILNEVPKIDFFSGKAVVTISQPITYSDFIPEMYPVSVDYFLIETLKSLSASADKKSKISEFLKLVEQCNSELKNIIPDFTSDDGRISFANFIQGLSHGKYQAKQFKSLVGVTDSTELTLTEITLWLFHDLHSIKLSTSK